MNFRMLVREYCLIWLLWCDKAFFIVTSCARVYYLKDAKDISDWFAFENEFISSTERFFLTIPSPHCIELLEDSILLEISKKDVEILSDAYADFERLSKLLITHILLHKHQRIISLQFYSAERKYVKILSIRPNTTQKVPLTHIASYIGITLETLSRIRNIKKAYLT